MVLRKLTLSGFKSFGEKVEIPFTAPITTIVGPNGSGKSNIADAFRFVLGEHSKKNMRGKIAEDIIWNGSAQKQRSNRAHVSIQLNNENSVIDLPFSVVDIERWLSRDGISEYTINKKTVTRKDIIKKLSQSYIGQSKHNIIGQGESDHLIHSSAEERAVILEDALGLRHLIIEKRDIEQNISSTKLSLEELEHYKKSKLPQLKQLKQQIDEQRDMKKRKAVLTAFMREYLSKKTEEIESKKENALVQKKYALEVIEEYKSSDYNDESLTYEESYKQAISDIKQRIRTATIDLHSRERVRDQLLLSISQQEKELEDIEKSSSHLGFTPPESHASVPRVHIDHVSEIVESYRDTHRGDISTRLVISDRMMDECEEMIAHTLSSHIQLNQEQEKEMTEKKEDILNSLFSLKEALEHAETSISESELLCKNLEEEEMQAIELLSTIASAITSREDAKQRYMLAQHDQKMADVIIAECDNDARILAEDTKEYVTLCGTRIFHSHQENEYNESDFSYDIPNDIQELKQYIEREYGALSHYEFQSLTTLEKEYGEIEREVHQIDLDINEINHAHSKLIQSLQDLENRFTLKWNNGIQDISKLFSQHIVSMFGGGRGELIDESKETERKVSLAVELPSKRVRTIHALSGGEKTLISLALLFALVLLNPPPFIVLDETDAALDEVNSARYGDLLEKISKHVQLIIITHNREVMARADLLHGVTMGKDGVSRLLSINLSEDTQTQK